MDEATVDERVGATEKSLVASDLRKNFRSQAGGRIEVLRGVSVSVAAGEMVAIMGASGAGKSTLLHILGGLEMVDGGSARLNEFEITKARAGELAQFRQQRVGFVFQFHHLLSDLTATENVALPLRMSRIGKPESERRAREALARVHLSMRADEPVTRLSGGEQQRVALARAVVRNPPLLLADEPTGNLDASAGDEIGQLLHAYAHLQRAAIIVATHNERIAQLCDRVLVLRNGKLEED